MLRTGLASPDDEKILTDARETIKQFGIPNYETRTISWASGMSASPVTIQKGEIFLSVLMRGKLTPDEWKPLVASTIVLDHIQPGRTRNTLQNGLILFGPMVAVIPVFLLIENLLPASGLPTSLLSIVILAVIAASAPVAGGSYSRRRFRAMWFRADGEVARVLGRETILQSLAKTRGLAQWEHRGRTVTSAPSLDQRVEKLQT